MPHRLLQARLAFDAAGRGASFAKTVATIAREPTVHRERLANILNFGADGALSVISACDPTTGGFP